MDSLEKCRRLYLKLSMISKPFATHDIKENPDWVYLRNELRLELSTLDVRQKFRHGIFDSILHDYDFIQQQPRWDYKLIARAFDYLEIYCRLLRNDPWKTEYHTIKTYGGFFRTYVFSALPRCLDILNIIGYSPATLGTHAKSTLKLNSLPNIALLETVGFDCLAASVECEIRSDVINKINKLHIDDKSDRIRDKNPKMRLLTDLKRRTSNSLPRTLEAGNHKLFSRDLLREISRSRAYHSEKLYLHQRRRSTFFELEDGSQYDVLNFTRTKEALKKSTLDKKSTTT